MYRVWITQEGGPYLHQAEDGAEFDGLGEALEYAADMARKHGVNGTAWSGDGSPVEVSPDTSAATAGWSWALGPDEGCADLTITDADEED
jgi:hypothetical protein